MLITKIKNLSSTLKTGINKLNSTLITRKRKLDFADLIYFLSSKNINNSSFNSTNFDITLKQYFDVSNSAIVKKQNLLEPSILESFKDSVLSDIFTQLGHTQRFICCDTSQVNLEKDLVSTTQFKVSKSNKYKTCMLSSLVDIKTEIPISYRLYNHENERKAVIDQLSYVKEGDVLIFDRGYYSKSLMDHLINRKINFIFRLPKSNNYSKLVESSISDSICQPYNGINIKILKYQLQTHEQYSLIDKKENLKFVDYFILTSLTDKKYNFNFFKDKYHDRWKVETNFRHAKYYGSLKHLKVKNERSLRINVIIHNFIFIISKYIEFLITKYKKISKDKKINTKLCLQLLTKSDYLYKLFKVNSIDDTEFIVEKCLILLKFLVPIQKNRHYIHEAKLPSTNWNYKIPNS